MTSGADVIYDRPVHELLAECADSLPEPFTRAEILAWFRKRYPAVRESTVSVHISELTQGSVRGHAYLGSLPAVIRRVGPGLYCRAASAATTFEHAVPLPATWPPDANGPAALTDIVLIGCVKSKLPRAAAARDLYTSVLFARRRRYAEATGYPWFVVSSRWGLLAPEEVAAPYDVYLGDMSAAYRRAWAEFVTAQLSDVGPLPGTVVEIHAGDHYVNALRPALEHAGAVVVDAVDAGSMGETLAWYDHHSPTAPATAGGLDITALVNHLSDSTRAMSPAELRATSRAALSHPGLYSWWVDDSGAHDLSHALGHLVEPGLVYAGLAGATRWPSGKSSTNTLWGRLVGMHLGGPEFVKVDEAGGC